LNRISAAHLNYENIDVRFGSVTECGAGQGNVVAAEDGFQKGANIFIGTVVSENGRYITVTRGSDHWRFRTVLCRETQIETSRLLANTSKMFIHTTQRTAVTKLRIAKVT
jgi:hypothetical protein